MKLYDFSVYANRRKALQAAKAVAGAATQLNEPGAVLELKSRISEWFSLHQEVLKQAKSA